jgi:mRNA interferase RelE/StbE
LIYKIFLKKSAVKDLKKLPSKAVKEISISIDKLANQPRPQGCKKLKDSDENLWRIRVGNYRIVYTIKDKIRIIEVRRIGHRKDSYH